MPLPRVDGAPKATRQSQSKFAVAAIVVLVGLGGASIGYLAAERLRGCATCAASRSPLTVGLYVAIASALAAWALATRK